MDWIPAIYITVAMPTPFHTSVPITENKARCVFPSQSTAGICINSRALLISPFEGCISAENVMPTAIVLTRFGKKTTDRKIFFVMILLVRNTAIKNANITFKPQVRTAYIRVFLMPILRESSVKNNLKFSNPQNLKLLKLHTVMLKNRDDTIGTKKNTAKTASAGTTNQVEYFF